MLKGTARAECASTITKHNSHIVRIDAVNICQIQGAEGVQDVSMSPGVGRR